MTAPTTTCPAWCAGPFDGHNFHYQQPVKIPSTNIGDLNVSVTYDEASGRVAIEVGEHELDTEQADELWLILAAATELAVSLKRSRD